MTIGKQINVRGNANVVADEVHIYLSDPPGDALAPAIALHALLVIALGVALGISSIEFQHHPALVGVLSVAFLISMLSLLRGNNKRKTRNGAIARRAEGHLQHDFEKPPRAGGQ
jgi:hypothetical protein